MHGMGSLDVWWRLRWICSVFFGHICILNLSLLFLCLSIFLRWAAFPQHSRRGCGVSVSTQNHLSLGLRICWGLWKNKTPNEKKQNELPLPYFIRKSSVGPGIEEQEPQVCVITKLTWSEHQENLPGVTIIVVHYLCLVPEKRFSFCNISAPIKLRT